MTIQLSDHFNNRKLLRFTAPTILMMVFASVYGVVDGLFVSNAAGKTAFAAINLIWPSPMALGAIGYMFGTGGCALVSKILGEGDEKRARSYFTAITLVAFFFGTFLASAGYALVEKVAIMLGAHDPVLLDYSVRYGRIIMMALPLFILQCLFQPFLIAAEKPGWGLMVTLFAGLVNILLDYLLVYKLNQDIRLKVEGAGWATLGSQFIGAVFPIILFALNRGQKLYFSRPAITWEALLKSCSNGLSEFVINISAPLVNLLYVSMLLRQAGENGVGAYGVIMYVNVVFFGVYTGYSMGCAPIVSYHYGARNVREIVNVLRRSLLMMSVFAVAVFIAAEFFANNVASMFAGYDKEFQHIVYQAFSIYSISFLFAPFNIYGSSFFTAMNNGKASAVISISRVLVFQALAVLLLPRLFGTTGFWIALPVAELLTLLVTWYCFHACRKIYFGSR